MATNYIQRGETITIPAPADVTGGEIVAVGALIGVAAGDAAEDGDLDLHLEGVFDLPKVSTEVIAVGDELFFDATPGVVTADDDEGANPRVGVAVAAAGNPSASVAVRLG